MDIKLSVVDFKPFKRNTLQGFVSLRVEDLIIIREVCFHEKDGKRWVSLPARPYKKADGNDGWQQLIEFVSNESRAQFQARAIAAVDGYFASTGEKKCS